MCYSLPIKSVIWRVWQSVGVVKPQFIVDMAITEFLPKIRRMLSIWCQRYKKLEKKLCLIGDGIKGIRRVAILASDDLILLTKDKSLMRHIFCH